MVCCVEERTEPEGKASIYRSIYIPTLTCGHELWVVTQRMRSWLDSALEDRVRSSDIWEEIRVEPLLLRVQRSQLRFRHLLRFLLDVSLGRCFPHVRPGGDPGAERGHAGQILSLGWFGKVSVSPRGVGRGGREEHLDFTDQAVALRPK